MAKKSNKPTKRQPAVWIAVDSSNVDAIRFVPDHDYPIQIRFLNGAEWGYTWRGRDAAAYNPKVFRRFQAAESKGKFVNSALKNEHNFDAKQLN